jgi:carbon storage regulator
MLVLSRKRGEKIVIPQYNITLTVLEIRGDRIRVGITAPQDVPVHRQEIWQRIHEFQNGAGEPAKAEPTPTA